MDGGRDMFDRRWCLEAVADGAAPDLKRRRLPEIDHVRLDALPAHEQQVAVRCLVGALQLQAVTALRGLEGGDGLGHTRLEFGLHAGFDGEGGDFKDHENSRSACAGRLGSRPFACKSPASTTAQDRDGAGLAMTILRDAKPADVRSRGIASG
jgi:hypothetical protein